MSGATLRFRIDLGAGAARAARRTRTASSGSLKAAASESAPKPVEQKARSAAPRHGTALRAARQLALAHEIERLIDAGELADYADLARRLGLSRARIAQVMGLLALSPAIQERVLLGQEQISSRSLRRAAGTVDWARQQQILEGEE